MKKKFNSLKDFYLFYLTEHSNKISRNLHFAGTSLFFLNLFWIVFDPLWWKFIVLITTPYFFAWIGHFFFEKNKPATFRYPFFSLASDFIMYKDIITGKIDKKMKEAKTYFPS